MSQPGQQPQLVQNQVPQNQQVTPSSPVTNGMPNGLPPNANNLQRPLSASLYVGDLDPEVGESLLFDIFKQVGPVVSIRVCRDAVTRRSLGYAYVNFHNIVDAERALDTLNYSTIKNQPCRIMWSHRDPSIRKSGDANVFIKNLDKQIDNKALYDTFSTFGNILSCKVVTDETGGSKGYGFVHYETKEAAEDAINSINGMCLNDKIVYVGHFIPKKDRKPVDPDETFTNIYVKNVPENMDENEIYEMFSAFGKITSHHLSKDDMGKSKGFGFINYENHEEALAAVNEMHEKVVGQDGFEKTLYVARAQKKAERKAALMEKYKKLREERISKWQGVNLYIKNLDDSVDEEQLRNAFIEFGNITSVKIMCDEKGNSRGFGFVCFSKPEEATKAVTEMNTKMLANKPLYVALAQRKEVRRAQLEQQHAQRQQNLRLQQNAGIGMTPMYPGTQLFYPQPPAQATTRQGPYVGYQQMVPRGPWRQNPTRGGPPFQGSMPNFVLSLNQRQQRQNNPRNPSGRGGGRGGFKMSNVTRNPNQMNVLMPGEANVANQGNQMDNLTRRLANARVDERKQILGDQLYPLIAQQTENPEKITGMILESTADTSDLLHLLEDPIALHEKNQ
jgi:polyadenylate-binding protein